MLSLADRKLGVLLGLGDLDDGYESDGIWPRCVGYQACCVCEACSDRAQAPDPAPVSIAQPWVPRPARVAA